MTKLENIRYELEKCLYLSKEGRPGPTVIDIPFNIQVAEINPNKLKIYTSKKIDNSRKYELISKSLISEIRKSKNL